DARNREPAGRGPAHGPERRSGDGAHALRLARREHHRRDLRLDAALLAMLCTSRAKSGVGASTRHTRGCSGGTICAEAWAIPKLPCLPCTLACQRASPHPPGFWSPLQSSLDALQSLTHAPAWE